MRVWLLVLLCLGATAQAGAESKQPPGVAVASGHYLATEAGLEILQQGGNAFDAAIAVSSVLAVVESSSSGIGGGGFWLLHLADENREVMIDGREFAPGKAHEKLFQNPDGSVNRDKALNGPLAAGIPGEPAALAWMAEHYGRLPLKQSLAPAIRIAEEGFPAYPKYIALMKHRMKVIRRYPASVKQLTIDGRLPREGELIRQPDLAHTLRLLAEKGHDGFYKGEVAKKLVAGVQAAGGIWTLDDLARYRVIEREPVKFRYKQWQVVTASLPSSGGIALATMLNILEPFDLEAMSEATRVHLVVEAMRRAYRDRAIYLGDPDFVQVPSFLTSKDYAAGLRASIRLDKATPSSMLPGPAAKPEGGHTTHFSLMDAEGNMVSATMSVNTSYGSCFIPPGTGVLLNNEMDDFSSKPGSPNAYGLIGNHANAIEPYKRMLSSMSPSMVFGDDRVAVLGTPGGSRIITMVLLGMLDFFEGHGPASWVSLPRYHHQYVPDKIYLEPDALSRETVQALEAMGHTVVRKKHTWGYMHGVMWDKAGQHLEAATDPRWPSGKAEVKPAP